MDRNTTIIGRMANGGLFPLRVPAGTCDTLPQSAIPAADDRMVAQIREGLRDWQARGTLGPQGRRVVADGMAAAVLQAGPL